MPYFDKFSREFLTEIIELLPYAVFIIDADSVIYAANETSAKFLNAKSESLIGSKLDVAITGFDFKNFLQTDFDRRVCCTIAFPVQNKSISLVVKKIDKAIILEDKPYYFASFHEVLPDVEIVPLDLDKESFFNRLDILVRNCCTDDQKSLAIFFLDIDNFKAVNDRFGHIIGDELLTQVMKRIKTTLRDDDLLFRYGGDEFVVVARLERKNALDDAQKIYQRLENIFLASFSCKVSANVITISASIGLAICPQNACDARVLIDQADKTMYQIKQRRYLMLRKFSTTLSLHRHYVPVDNRCDV